MGVWNQNSLGEIQGDPYSLKKDAPSQPTCMTCHSRDLCGCEKVWCLWKYCSLRNVVYALEPLYEIGFGTLTKIIFSKTGDTFGTTVNSANIIPFPGVFSHILKMESGAMA